MIHQLKVYPYPILAQIGDQTTQIIIIPLYLLYTQQGYTPTTGLPSENRVRALLALFRTLHAALRILRIFAIILLPNCLLLSLQRFHPLHFSRYFIMNFFPQLSRRAI